MASAEENILLSRLLDLFREDPDRIRSLVQAGTSASRDDSTTKNSPSPSPTASSPATNSPGSRSSDPEVDLPAANSGAFTADELLKPRSRKMKATAAQQTFAFILREAAKKCEIWDSAPHIKDIPAKDIAKFEKKIDKYKGMACNRLNPKDGKSVVDVIKQRLEGSGFVFKSAEDLLIMDGDTRLARVTYIGHAKRNSDYVKVVLQSVYSTVGATKIPLCGLNSEQWLQDIKVGQKFYWPENQVVKASRIKSTKKKHRKSRQNKKVKAGEGDGVVAGHGGNVGEFEDVAVAMHVLADEGKKKKKKQIKRADSTTGVAGVAGVLAGDGGNVGEGVTVAVNVAAEAKKKKKKKNKRAESTAGVEGVVAGDDVVAADDVVTCNDVADDDVVVDDDVDAGEGANVVVVGDEDKKKENKRAGSDVKGEAGKKRKKPSWEYVPIVTEVEEELPPKRRRPQKKNEDFVSY